MTSSMIRSRPELLFVVGLVLLVARPAWADRAAARATAARAQAEYNVGHFSAAIELFTQAYSLEPAPGLLFNIAQSYRQLGDHERAAFFYRRYLSLSVKRPANAALVQQLIVEEEGKIAPLPPTLPREPKLSSLEPRQAPDSAPAWTKEISAPGASTSTPLVKRWWFWTGLGAAATAVGTATYLVATAPRPSSPTTLGEVSTR